MCPMGSSTYDAQDTSSLTHAAAVLETGAGPVSLSEPCCWGTLGRKRAAIPATDPVPATNSALRRRTA